MFSQSTFRNSCIMKTRSKIKIAIVGSNFQKTITDTLEANCIKTLNQNGISKEQITVIRVPGSLEIPLAAKKLAKKSIYDAIIALGAIHKGDTHHFELIANECARGCMDVSLQHEVPVIFEVLAVYNIKDAIDRATREKENRGVEAALSALTTIDALSKL